MIKKRIGLLFGGCSSEHNVSIDSARNILPHFDRTKFDILPLYLTQNRSWYVVSENTLTHCSPKNLVQFFPYNNTTYFQTQTENFTLDCIFPLVHGTHGEDGCIPGLLEILGIPYVGCDPKSSVLCMHKQLTKQHLHAAGLPTAKWVDFRYTEKDLWSYNRVTEALGTPIFVKPTAQGSSIGVGKVSNSDQYKSALQSAFSYDDHVLIEQAIEGREIECSILGNHPPQASALGEIITHANYDFYSYAAKYHNGALTQQPLDLAINLVEKIQQLSLQAFSALYCQDMARIDFFLTKEKNLFINEINTIPGFTKISLYPQNWERSQLPLQSLLSQLIYAGLEKKQSLFRAFTPP